MKTINMEKIKEFFEKIISGNSLEVVIKIIIKKQINFDMHKLYKTTKDELLKTNAEYALKNSIPGTKGR